jgi:isocitrate lyase
MYDDWIRNPILGRSDMAPAEIRSISSERLQREWDADERWTGIGRGYGPDEVIRLRGSVAVEHSLAARAPRSSGASSTPNRTSPRSARSPATGLSRW